MDYWQELEAVEKVIEILNRPYLRDIVGAIEPSGSTKDEIRARVRYTRATIDRGLYVLRTASVVRTHERTGKGKVRATYRTVCGTRSDIWSFYAKFCKTK